MFATHDKMLEFTIIHLLLTLYTTITCFATTSLPKELLKGFSAVPLSTPTSFQPLLTDSTRNFSLGFLRHNQNNLQLAVVHVPSSEPFWIAKQTPPASWSDTTRLFFNGSLVLWDPKTGASWSTATNGNRVVLLNTSNLQVQNKNNDKETPLWESFQFPTNTLVEGQNLTATMSLVSSNNLYSLQLSDNFMGLYANYNNEEKRASLSKRLLYWKRTPLEAKAEIKEGQGPIYARVSNEGYLGMYQTSTKPVDVQKFNTFQQTSSFLVVRLEPDGNLKGYYWDVAKSTWQLNYQAITETCDLPNPCGSYGLCTPGGSGCSCLDNKTRFEPGGCLTGEKDDENETETVGNLCGKRISTGENNYKVMRKNGVEAPHKELLGHVTTSSLEECEGLCEKNCSCWGAMYSNFTRVCYILEYPIRSMLGSGDVSKVGYFKVRKGVGKKNKVGIVVSVLVGIVVFVVVTIGVGIWVMRLKRRKRMMKVVEENGASPGPYRNLGSASFRSIEMCSSNGNGE